MNRNDESIREARALGSSRVSQGYRIVRVFGRSGAAVAFEVVHLGTGERRAAKLLPSAALLDPSLAQQRRREARVLCRLRHLDSVRVS